MSEPNRGRGRGGGAAGEAERRSWRSERRSAGSDGARSDGSSESRERRGKQALAWGGWKPAAAAAMDHRQQGQQLAAASAQQQRARWGLGFVQGVCFGGRDGGKT
ncbi:hypothetical protein Scep_006256 [Stephania cephalantha]|uniref:Uncharacterized protein n=1 Tax=Stephania cephalantha TaxID=152367 RepID=A0AAP0K9J3_9MAGN